MTITITNILDTLTTQANAHDEFIGELMEKYNLPPHEAKSAEYDEPMTDMLLELSNDIEERFDYIEALYNEQYSDLDENAKDWLKACENMKEHLREEIENIENKEEYANIPFDDHANREFLEELYVNEHEAFVAMHQGAKMIAMLTMFGE